MQCTIRVERLYNSNESIALESLPAHMVKVIVETPDDKKCYTVSEDSYTIYAGLKMEQTQIFSAAALVRLAMDDFMKDHLDDQPVTDRAYRTLYTSVAQGKPVQIGCIKENLAQSWIVISTKRPTHPVGNKGGE